MQETNGLKHKIIEAVTSVVPIILIVAALCFSIIPMPTDIFLSFLIGSVMVVVGLGLFMYGSDHSIAKIGSLIGAKLTKTQNIFLILFMSFLVGIIVTVAEPDLQVLAKNVPHIQTTVLILTVSVGVGFFLMLCMFRILFGISLRLILIVSYTIIFILVSFSDSRFLSVAFDSGGVTTGPMTAPFIMAMGIGVASIRSDKNAEADSFGLVALSSIGPILAVLLLGLVYSGEEEAIAALSAATYADTVKMSGDYLLAFPEYMLEVGIALLPILVFFLLFQAFMLKLRRIPFIRIIFGLIFTYEGLVLFLTGVNVGFSSLGVILGNVLTQGYRIYVLLPVIALMGWFIISAEPAVHVLTKQVEEISAGAISQKSMKLSISIAIALAMVFSCIRAMTGISILWFVIPGYVISLLLSFFVPPIFTAIAFDSGGVASGPMSATFMLPFVMGVCQAVDGNILTDAFGIVAMVAMMPLITIQGMGAIVAFRDRRTEKQPEARYGELDIIELWEVD